MTRAIVLSAGLGTRLRPLTDWVPKPLVWLGDRPQIDHILARLADAGVDTVVVNTHHLHEQFDDAWASRQPVRVVRIHEPEILGTGGGVHNAADSLGPGSVLVWNGDILADVDLRALFAAHERDDAAATLVVAPTENLGVGTIGLDARGNVARLRGERFGEEVSSGDYIGVAMVGDRVRGILPVNGCLVGDGLMPLLRSGGRVATFVHERGFRDTGSLEAYLDANLAWLGERSSFVGEGASVDAAVSLERAVVGPSAHVRGSGVVRASIVWPGAETTAPLERAIATPRGTIVVG